jgi:predicted component of type VI protein secretion system
MPVLRLVPESGDALEFSRESTVVGRDASACDVLVADGSVSRRHAIVERRPTSWVIVDQDSANGTWIEERRVKKAVLLHGHKLRLGAVRFSVVIEDAVPAPAPPVLPTAAPLPPAPSRAMTTMPFAPGATGGPGPHAAGAGARMSIHEAAAVLGVAPGASPEEVRRKYQKFFNEMQVRLTNAPTPALKRMYQKSLADARTAAEVLCPGLSI